MKGFRIFSFIRAWQMAAMVLCLGAVAARGEDWFAKGLADYDAARFVQAADDFRSASESARTAAAFYNLGDAEWQSAGVSNSDGRVSAAILAWERAQWLAPYNRNATANLRYARRARQLETPDLAWYEICSTWLPVNAWAWLACASFWLAIAMVMLPGIFGWRRTSLKQTVAAASFAIFLLTIPALIGIRSRASLGIVMPDQAPLRLTPTAEAQVVTRLPAGASARLERTKGKYVYVRAGISVGWLEREQFALIARETIQ